MSEKKNGIDKGLIRDLADILNETDLTEIEVEQEDLRIRVSRASNMQYVQAPIATAPAVASSPAASAVPAARENANALTVPMVGTVYLSPAPGSAPVIEVGARVKAAQSLRIIAAKMGRAWGRERV